MGEVIKVDGGNNYKMPHLGKMKNWGRGKLPSSLKLDDDLKQKVSELNVG